MEIPTEILESSEIPLHIQEPHAASKVILVFKATTTRQHFNKHWHIIRVIKMNLEATKPLVLFYLIYVMAASLDIQRSTSGEFSQGYIRTARYIVSDLRHHTHPALNTNVLTFQPMGTWPQQRQTVRTVLPAVCTSKTGWCFLCICDPLTASLDLNQEAHWSKKHAQLQQPHGEMGNVCDTQTEM